MPICFPYWGQSLLSTIILCYVMLDQHHTKLMIRYIHGAHTCTLQVSAESNQYLSHAGEYFFWYWLTWVVPYKIHRAVKWLCVCVCVCALEGKWLELSTPNFVRIYGGSACTLTQRSNGQRSESHGYKNRHGHMSANGCCGHCATAAGV